MIVELVCNYKLYFLFLGASPQTPIYFLPLLQKVNKKIYPDAILRTNISWKYCLPTRLRPTFGGSHSVSFHGNVSLPDIFLSRGVHLTYVKEKN